MHLPISFYAALPAPLPAATSFIPTWTAALGPLELLGYALDAGYGSPTDLLDKTTMPRQLRQFMTLRMRSAWQLLKKDHTGYQARSFVSQLDTTDMGDASTILGSICARASIAVWLRNQTPRQKVLRFWHYSVYTNRSVGKRVVSLNWGLDKSAPDFLVCAKASSGPQIWYPLEAKGTLGPRKWSLTTRGLAQAAKVGMLQIYTKGPTFNYYPIKAFCSQAHLHGSPPYLKATLVDPPPAEGAHTLELCEPLGVLHQLARSATQWEELTSGKASPSANGHRWAKVTRGLGFGASLELGISNAVYDAKATIVSLIRAFDLLVEHVVEPYLERVGQQASYSKSPAALQQIVSSARDVLNGQQIDKSTGRLASELLTALQAFSSPSPSNWGEMMSLLVTARVDLSGQGTETTSVAEWANALDTQVSVLPLVDRLARATDSADTRFLLNGLAIRQLNKPKLEARSPV